MTLALATLLTLAGVLALRLARHWGRRQRPQRQLVLRWTGWLLLVVSLLPWTVAGGSDRGVALAILVLMLAGLSLALFEGWRAWRAPARKKRERTPRNDLPRPETRGKTLLLRRIWIFVLAGPLALAGALAIGMALWLGLAQAGVSEANVLAVAMISVPIIWAVFSGLATMEGRLAPRTLLVALPGLLGLAVSLVMAGSIA